METLVSVVIPTYNHEKFIGKTIESVLNQTYKRLEIIIADDASTDQTNVIIANYSQKDPRIKHLTTDYNLGIPKNFNRAFDNCTGKYVAFIGGDDRMHPDKIEKQLYFLENNPSHVLCFHDMEHIDLATEKRIRLQSELGKPSLNPLDWIFPVDWFFSKKYAGILPSACMAKAGYFLHARYNESLRYKHELLFTLDNYMHDKDGKWGYIEEVLGQYGVHDSNFSMQEDNTKLIEEETFKLCDLANQRYPLLQKRIESHLHYYIFKHLLFNWVTGAKQKEYERRLRREGGILKYLYLMAMKVYIQWRRK